VAIGEKKGKVRKDAGTSEGPVCRPTLNGIKIEEDYGGKGEAPRCTPK